MSLAKKVPIAFFILALTILAGANLPAQAQDQQLPPQDVVVLVDCSQSAEPYIKPIIGILSRFVGGSRPGDTFTCYQFSKKPVLVARKRLKQPGDIAQLRSQLQQIRVGEKVTNYATALERAMEEISRSSANRPESERVLILITDGRRYAGDPKSERKALEQLFARYSGIKAAKDFSFYCFFIGDWPEEDLQKYLTTVGVYSTTWPRDAGWLEKLNIADVRIMQPAVFLGHMPDLRTDETFSIAFFPRRSPTGTMLIELDTQTNFGETSLDKYFTVTPRHLICRKNPWNEEFSLEARGFDKGTYSGSFTFKPNQPEALLLYPRVVNFSFSISGSLLVDIPASLMFGPTGLKGEYGETRQISIAPGRAGLPGSANAVSVASDIELPEGVELELTKTMNADAMVVKVTVLRSQNLSAQAIGKYEGKIIINSQKGWRLSDNEIPIVVDVSETETASRNVLLYVLIAGGCLGVTVAIFLFFKSARKGVLEYFSQSERPTGKLILIYDPTNGTATNINLDRLAENMDIKEVTVGVGPGTFVELSHVSMLEKIYSFTGYKDTDGIRTVVKAGQGRDEVIINDMSRTGEITLRHLDMIKLGAFEYRFEMSRPLRQVVLYYLNGEATQGWLRSWNIDAEGFHFIPRGGDKKEMYVRYYELKTVAFVRDFDGELCERLLTIEAPRSGHRARLFLADQEELTGYILDWQDPGEKFYFFPDSMGDNVLFFLLENSTIRNLVLIKEDEKSARQAQRVLYNLLSEMKSEVAG